MLARRGEIRDLIHASFAFSVHCEYAVDVEINWASRCGDPLTAFTVRGHELPSGDWRVRALRALFGEAIMAARDY
jgi:hypothetical protein